MNIGNFEGPFVMVHTKLTVKNKSMLLALAKQYGVHQNVLINNLLTTRMEDSMAKKTATKKVGKKSISKK